MIDRDGLGLTAAEIVKRAHEPALGDSPEVVEMLAEAVGALATSRTTGKPDGKRLGYRLRSLRRRVVDGHFIDLADGSKAVNSWVVRHVGTFSNPAETCPSSPSCPQTDPAPTVDMVDIVDMSQPVSQTIANGVKYEKPANLSDKPADNVTATSELGEALEI